MNEQLHALVDADEALTQAVAEVTETSSDTAEPSERQEATNEAQRPQRTRGRPRKFEPVEEVRKDEQRKTRGRPPKVDVEKAADSASEAPKKRGRPPMALKRRGRPPKYAADDTKAVEPSVADGTFKLESFTIGIKDGRVAKKTSYRVMVNRPFEIDGNRISFEFEKS